MKIAGFVTRESLDTIGLADMMAVYIPQSYNFAGNLIVVPKEQVIPIDMESGKVIALTVSGGVSGFKPPVPSYLNSARNLLSCSRLACLTALPIQRMVVNKRRSARIGQAVE